ncbi:hypothetical protein BGW38_000705 [Lunasporangiospora selenospora]|uniref:EamA domain-containing protein n=1 Tax=Lunasporangiospora selenospora TaxID=979761 RepID=A0A9P6KE08_9FUNG|nr:hypothetical protein BGW38_000705 [Lunasporangiospora selenospora]
MHNIFAGKHYNKPFFVTYVNTASFSLYLLGPLFKQWRPRRQPESDAPLADHPNKDGLARTRAVDSAVSLPSTVASIDSSLEQGQHAYDATDDAPLTYREVAQLSLTFCILWFAANWATNASLAYTTVASSTILASMSGFFTLAIGSFLKTESFSAVKLAAVCMSVLGVAFVSKSDHGSPNLEPTAPKAPLFGDFLALMSALFYGCYTVLLKVRIQNENRVNMSLFFGFVGLFNLLLLWPIFGVLHYTGIERFEFPSDPSVICMIIANAFVGTFVSDYLWLLSMLMTSPLVVTLGLSLTIPLALLGDVFGYGRVLGVGYWIGAGLVLAGFFGVNGAALSEQRQLEEEEGRSELDEAPLSPVSTGSMTSRFADEEEEPLLKRINSRP